MVSHLHFQIRRLTVIENRMNVETDDLSGRILGVYLGVEDPNIGDLAVATDGDEASESGTGIVIIGGEDVLENDVLEEVESFPLSGISAGEYPDIMGVLVCPMRPGPLFMFFHIIYRARPCRALYCFGEIRQKK